MAEECYEHKKKRSKDDGRYVSTFDISVGEEVVRLSKLGYSMEAIAGSLGVNRRTIYSWQEKHPEFKELCQKAQSMRIFAWETKMVEAESGPSVQAASLALRASGLRHWNDKQQVAIEVEHKHQIDLTKMSAPDIEALMQIVGKQEQLAITDADYEEVD